MTSRKTTTGGDETELAIDPNPTERRVRLAADNTRLLHAEREARARAERAAQRMARLLAVTASLAEALTRDEVAAAVLREGMPALGASSGQVVVAGADDRLLVVRSESIGAPSSSVETDLRMHITDASPVADAMRTRIAVVLSTPEEIHARYPALATAADGTPKGAFLAVPLVTGGKAIGAFALGFEEARSLDEEDRGLLFALGHQCVQALERARLWSDSQAARAEAEENERRQRFLADASRVFSASLDYETTLIRIAERAVPEFADWCTVDMIDTGAETVRRVAAAHRDPEKRALCFDYARLSPARLSEPRGAGATARSGQAQLLAEISLAELWERAPEALETLRKLAPSSAVIVPLVARDRILGALSFVYAESGRRYVEADVPFVEELALRAGMAIENARLYGEAERVNHAKDEFLATLSHELRNPLNAMLGWTRLLRAGNLDEKTRDRALETVERNARSQAQLIEDLLDVSRIITGKMRLNVTVCDLCAVVRAAIDTLRPAADARQIVIACAFDETASNVSGDAERLQQVVWNLLSNAIKFTPPRGRIEITLGHVDSVDASGALGTGIELRVKDSGPGVPAHFVPYVFDRFRQADPSTRRSHSGLGLGLAITRHLVELHGGTIAVERARNEADGSGASFVVRLPFRGVQPHAAITERRRIPGAGESAIDDRVLDGLSVLAVDDDPDARELLGAALTQHGASARVVGSVEQAIRAVESAPPDLVLSDIGMPVEDGFDLIRKLRAHADTRVASLPAIAVTAYAHADDERRVLAAGFDAHVAKPIEPSALALLVRRLALEAKTGALSRRRSPPAPVP